MEELKNKILKKSTPEPNTGCWLWDNPTEVTKGFFYGHLNGTYAHRESYRLFVGEIEPGFVICHKCDTPACVNPDHLFKGTQRDNLLDACRKGRRIKKKCFRGHIILDENKMIRSNGATCRACWNITRRAYRARLKQKLEVKNV